MIYRVQKAREGEKNLKRYLKYPFLPIKNIGLGFLQVVPYRVTLFVQDVQCSAVWQQLAINSQLLPQKSSLFFFQNWDPCLALGWPADHGSQATWHGDAGNFSH